MRMGTLRVSFSAMPPGQVSIALGNRGMAPFRLVMPARPAAIDANLNGSKPHKGALMSIPARGFVIRHLGLPIR
jgi:hypothetical protein